MGKTLIMGTADNAGLVELIGKQLGLKFQPTIRHTFGDGVKYYRIDADLAGKNVIFVASTNSDENLLELYRLGCALAGYGVKSIIFSIPFFGYSTMERAAKKGEVVTAKTSTRMLSSIPHIGTSNIFLMMDLHVSTILHYFEGNCLRMELSAMPVLIKAVEVLNLENLVIASADLGSDKRVQKFAKALQVEEMAFAVKSRDMEKTRIESIIGDVKDKTVVIYDDMTRSGSTLIQAAEAYLEKGAKEIYAVLSHLALNNQPVVKTLIASPIKKILSTNTHPMSQNELVQNSDKFVIEDVSQIFSESIKRLL